MRKLWAAVLVLCIPILCGADGSSCTGWGWSDTTSSSGAGGGPSITCENMRNCLVVVSLNDVGNGQPGNCKESVNGVCALSQASAEQQVSNLAVSSLPNAHSAMANCVLAPSVPPDNLMVTNICSSMTLPPQNSCVKNGNFCNDSADCCSAICTGSSICAVCLNSLDGCTDDIQCCSGVCSLNACA